MTFALLAWLPSLHAETIGGKVEDAIERPFVKKWTVEDLSAAASDLTQRSMQQGRKVFHQAGCIKCHVIAGEGAKYGPDLTDVAKRFKGPKLLEQVLKPSTEIHKEFETFMFLLDEGQVVSGLIVKKEGKKIHVLPNPLKPEEIEIIDQSNIDEWRKSDVSTMPENMLDTFRRDEILDLLAFVQAGGK